MCLLCPYISACVSCIQAVWWRLIAGLSVSSRGITDNMGVREVNKQVIFYVSRSHIMERNVSIVVFQKELLVQPKFRYKMCIVWSLLHMSNIPWCSTWRETWHLKSMAVLQMSVLYPFRYFSTWWINLLGHLCWISNFGSQKCGSYIFFFSFNK